MLNGSRWPPSNIRHSPFTIHHSPFNIHHSPFTIHHSPFTIHHSPFLVLFRPLNYAPLEALPHPGPPLHPPPAPARHRLRGGLRVGLGAQSRPVARRHLF